jgi:GNAT superfamily N-acetyltransferase
MPSEPNERSVASYRPAIPGDLDLICRHRHEMFKASGRTDAIVQPSTNAFKDWLKPRIDDGSYFGWIAQIDGVDVAGLGMMVIDWPPHPSHPLQANRGYILNVFVEPLSRRRGLARALMGIAMEEAKQRNLQYLILHATAMAMPMYEKLGWRRTSEMSMTLSV